MKKYYFFDGTTQHGPFTLEELKAYNITPQTSVWFDAIPQWKPAGDIPELQSLFNISAPASDVQGDWNNIDFYFMDVSGIQQGPFKLNQLSGKINAQTQIWYAPLANWTTAGQVPVLKNIIGSIQASVNTTAVSQPAQTNWNAIDFYFMDSAGVQQGPLKLSQLAGKINAQTQVWYDPLPKWTTAGEVAALKNLVSSAQSATVSTSTIQPAQTDWNAIDFYFMDSAGVQQGPLKLSQLAGKINAQTQVWYDPLPKWTTAGEVAALKNLLSSAQSATVSTSTTQPAQTNWNAIDFYFMDSAGVQQGPLKLNQLAGKINAQTQVWYDPLPKWTTAGEVAALKQIIDASIIISDSSTGNVATAVTEDWSKKQFFIADANGTQQGPLTLKQLEDKNITEATAVWYDPLPNWTTAGEVAALKQIVDAAKAKLEEWKNKFYFFADATGTRQGPFKLDQLKDKNITSATPIWYDPLTEWTTAGEVTVLKDIITK